MSRTFYRLVNSDPPDEDDFRSHADLGIPVVDPSPPDIARGISVQATEAQILGRARIKLNARYIAVLEVPDDGSVRVERTGTARGHHTIWGSPAELLNLVARVYRIPGR